MFYSTARSIDNQAAATAFRTAYVRYAGETEAWFDGTPQSIDGRIARANRLLHLAKESVSRQGMDADKLASIGELQADVQALTALRHDLLTAGADREDNSPIAGVHVASEWSERERVYAPDDDYDPAFDIDYDDPDWEEHFENAMKMRDELKAKGVPTTRREVREKKELERALQSGELSSAESGLTVASRTAMPVPRGTDPHFTPHQEGGPHGDIYLGDGDWKSDYGMEPDDEDRARWKELTKQRDQRLQEYIDRTGLDPYVPESQAREEKAERDRRKKKSSRIEADCGDDEEYAGGEDDEDGAFKEGHRTAGHDVVWEGQACQDCTMVIANDDDSGCGPEWSRETFHHHTKDLPGEGPLVISSDEPSFGRGPCDTCGSRYDGDFHKVVALGPTGHKEAGYFGDGQDNDWRDEGYGDDEADDKRDKRGKHRMDEVGGSGRPVTNPYTGDDGGSFSGNPKGRGHWDKEAASEEDEWFCKRCDSWQDDPHNCYDCGSPKPSQWDKEDTGPFDIKDHERRKGSLSPGDQRFVVLESARFLADNTDTDDVRELATRAQHFAQRVTSTYSADRSQVVTTAFVRRVASAAAQRRDAVRREPSGMSRQASIATALPPEAMFL